MASTENVIEQFRTTTLHFIMSELEAAEIFADIALQSDDSDRVLRNTKNARWGYDTALRSLHMVSLTLEENRFISARIESVRSKLTELGEEF